MTTPERAASPAPAPGYAASGSASRRCWRRAGRPLDLGDRARARRRSRRRPAPYPRRRLPLDDFHLVAAERPRKARPRPDLRRRNLISLSDAGAHLRCSATPAMPCTCCGVASASSAVSACRSPSASSPRSLPYLCHRRSFAYLYPRRETSVFYPERSIQHTRRGPTFRPRRRLSARPPAYSPFYLHPYSSPPLVASAPFLLQPFHPLPLPSLLLLTRPGTTPAIVRRATARGFIIAFSEKVVLTSHLQGLGRMPRATSGIR